MTQTIEGDWRMLIEDEPIGPDNRVYTFRDGLVVDAADGEVGSYSSPEAGHYLFKIGERDCEVRSVEDGAAHTLTGWTNFGDWSDPVVFFRVRYDIRSPESLS